MKGHSIHVISNGNSNFLGNFDADPSGYEGAFYYNTVSKLFKYNNGVGWSNIDSPAGAVALDDVTDVTLTAPANDDFLQRKAAVWVNRTPAQAGSDLVTLQTEEATIDGGDYVIIYDVSAAAARKMTRTNFVAGLGAGAAVWGAITGTLSDQTDLQTELDGKQDLDADLTAIAALVPSNDDIIQRKAGAWSNRTMAQLKSDLLLNSITTVGVTGALTALPRGTAIYIVTAATTQTLPTAVGDTTVYVVKNSHASADVVVDTTGAETIEGSPSITIPAKNAVMIVSDNANWHIF